MSPLVTEVRFVRADDALRATGLLGWTSFLVDGRLKIEGVAVRRTTRGRLTLAFARRDDCYGRSWRFVYPIDDETRRAIEEQVLGQLRVDLEAPRGE